MTEVATAALAGLSVAEATPQTAANHGMPPGRVRHMFKTLDTDGNGTLSSEELKAGFAKEFKVDALAPHVRTTEARTNPHSGPHHKRRPPVLPCTGRCLPAPTRAHVNLEQRLHLVRAACSTLTLTLHSVKTLHPLHLSRRRRSWPAWMRCSACTPTRRMAKRRPSASPDPAPALARTLAQALALAPLLALLWALPLPLSNTSTHCQPDPRRRPHPSVATGLAPANCHPSGARAEEVLALLR